MGTNLRGENDGVRNWLIDGLWRKSSQQKLMSYIVSTVRKRGDEYKIII